MIYRKLKMFLLKLWNFVSIDMNIVYWFIFEDCVKNKILLYYYIGSKLNCLFENGIIYDFFGKEYWSLCK